ncbi:MAG: glycosyltransferase, partial [Actinomycetota bacterium]
MKSLLAIFDRLLQVRQNLIRVRTLRTVWWFAMRVRARAWAAGGRVTFHGRAFGTQIRGVRIRVRRGARVHLFLGEWVALERGTELVLGTGTLYLDGAVKLGPRCVLEVDEGGALVVSSGARVGVGCVLSAVGRDVEIRPEAVVGDYAVVGIGGEGPVVVGARARVGPRAVLEGGARVADAAPVPAHTAASGRVGRAPAGPRARGRAPEVSVVVSSKNRAEYLPRLFDALARQRFPARRFELVLVDDGSTDDSPAVLRELASAAPFEVRVV